MPLFQQRINCFYPLSTGYEGSRCCLLLIVRAILLKDSNAISDLNRILIISCLIIISLSCCLQKHESGNKDGNCYLKMAFHEASVKAVRYYREITQFYQSKTTKKHISIAWALVSKEIAKISYFVLKNKRPYDNKFKGEQLSRVKSLQWPRLACPDAYLLFFDRAIFLIGKSGVVPLLYLGLSRWWREISVAKIYRKKPLKVFGRLLCPYDMFKVNANIDDVLRY